jgi:hypothetical protein
VEIFLKIKLMRIELHALLLLKMFATACITNTGPQFSRQNLEARSQASPSRSQHYQSLAFPEQPYQRLFNQRPALPKANPTKGQL